MIFLFKLTEIFQSKSKALFLSRSLRQSFTGKLIRPSMYAVSLSSIVVMS